MDSRTKPIGYYPNGDPIFQCEDCGLCGDDCDCNRERERSFEMQSEDEDAYFSYKETPDHKDAFCKDAEAVEAYFQYCRDNPDYKGGP